MKNIDRKPYIVEALKKFPKAKTVPVYNFAGTAVLEVDGGYPLTVREINEGNLIDDANMYRWNTDTVKAIRYALEQIYKAANI